MNPSLTIAKTALILPLSAIGLGVANVFSLKLSEKTGVKYHCGIFIILYSLCLYSMALTSSYLFGFLVAACLAVSYGMINVPTQSVGWGWYPKSQGMVTGILLSSHGFIGILINFLVVYWMNPGNKKASVKILEGKTYQLYYTADIYMRFPITITYMSIGSLVIGILGAYLITENKAKDKLLT